MLNNIKRFDLDRVINEFKGIIVGNSAGALILCRKTIIIKDEGNEKTLVLDGLNLVDFSVEVHYNGSQDSELLSLDKDILVYVVPEKCALVYSDGKVKLIGDVRIFHSGVK
mgnify:CR=1 FL=1